MYLQILEKISRHRGAKRPIAREARSQLLEPFYQVMCPYVPAFGQRIMDLDQYLEKMITNTIVI